MLQPDTRRVLLEALRPPEGYAVDRAIATTYTLDLTALLIAPLAFAMLDGLCSRAKPTAPHVADSIDPFALLKAVRGSAERTTVFCQAGRIAVPTQYRRLLTYVEESVVEVAPAEGTGVFHPKVWVLRMLGPEKKIAYRVLVLSRNLTFDRSWDTLVALDGELAQDRTRAISANRPLAEFVASLPGLAINKQQMRPQSLADVKLIADELLRVHFELPEGFDEYAFYPIGIAGRTGAPFLDTRCDKRFVISPFVTAGGLADLSGKGGTLVSRLEELDKIPRETLATFDEVLVLNDQADQLEDTEEHALDVHEGTPPPTGLHAKVYVTDDGWDTHLWTGSANATTAAFAQNVEFVVRLRGKRSVEGVDKTKASLDALLVPYPGAAEESGPSDAQRELEERLRVVRSEVASAGWAAVTGDSSNGAYPFILYARPSWTPPADVTLEAKPISLSDAFWRDIVPGSRGMGADFSGASFEALTTFFAIRMNLTVGELSAEEIFVVNAPLEGAPSNRIAMVLQSMLDDPTKVLRFLRLLLALDPFEVLAAIESDDGLPPGGGTPRATVDAEAPLLEAMLKALAHEPSRLDAIGQVVADLMASTDGHTRLPPGFLAAWEPIQKARLTLKAGAR
jgi:hypothetical protein